MQYTSAYLEASDTTILAIWVSSNGYEHVGYERGTFTLLDIIRLVTEIPNEIIAANGKRAKLREIIIK